MGGRASDFVQQLNSQFGVMEAQRAPYDAVWSKVAMYESEHMNMFTSQPNAHSDTFLALRRDPKDVDNTARQAISIFSSGMLSGVSPPSDQWFRLKVADVSGGEDKYKWRHIASYLEKLERIFMADFTAKNFYSQQVSSYKNIGLYGIQCMYIGYNSDIGTYYKDISPDEIYVANDYAGRVNCVFRRIQITMQQAIELFGRNNLSVTRQRQIDTPGFDPQSTMDIIHAVYKKSPGFENILSGNQLPFASFYFEPGEDHLISEEGYQSMPYIVTRAYSDSRTPYSISPGTVALSDVLMVNQLKLLMLQAGQLSIAPPVLMPDRGLVGRLNYKPSAVNLYRKDATTSADDFRPLNITGDFQLSMQLLQMAQSDIKNAFFVDLFLMIHNRVSNGQGTPTATEIQQLATEKSFLLAPILINQQQENFNNTFSRVYELMYDQPNRLPPLPDDLRGTELEIRYEAPLVRAQQAVQTQGILQSLQEMAGIAQVYPSVVDVLDPDLVVRRVLENRGMPQSFVKEVEEVLMERKQRAEAQQQEKEAMAAQAQQTALLQGYEGLSKAPETGSPAGTMLQQMTGGAI